MPETAYTTRGYQYGPVPLGGHSPRQASTLTGKPIRGGNVGNLGLVFLKGLLTYEGYL